MADVIITITIKDENVGHVKDAFWSKYPKQEGDTFAQGLKKYLRKEIKKIVQEYDEQVAMEDANVQVNTILDAARASVVVPDSITE